MELRTIDRRMDRDRLYIGESSLLFDMTRLLGTLLSKRTYLGQRSKELPAHQRNPSVNKESNKISDLDGCSN